MLPPSCGFGAQKVAELGPAASQKTEKVPGVKSMFAGSVCYDDSERGSFSSLSTTSGADSLSQQQDQQYKQQQQE